MMPSERQEGVEMKQQGEPDRRGLMRAVGVGLAGAAVAMAMKPRLAMAADRKPRWGFLVDSRKCIGCLACTVACKAEYGVPLGVFRCTVKKYEHGKFPQTKRDFLPTVCNHCEKPACIEKCPTKEKEHTFKHPDGTEEKFKGKAATFKQPNGLVMVDHKECTGCGKCIKGCPYGVRFRHPMIKAGQSPEGKDLKAVDKCTLCQHRLEKGLVPACVQTCLGGARMAGDLNDPESEISKALAANKGELKVLLPKKKTEPNCHYLGLDDPDEVFEEGMDLRDAVDEA